MPSANPAAARILVVDDEEANVDLLEQMLAGAGYANVTATTDSRAALALVEEVQPDLILLDLLMPHLDGFTVMEQVRQTLTAETFLPIVVLTADATPETKRRALERGATDFLTKPFDRVELLLRVRNLLQTRALHRRLEEQVRRLEAVHAEARRALELRSQQFAAITHDLGQPLASMRIALAVQRRDDPDAGRAPFEAMVNRMLEMVVEMLDLSRLESGRPLDLEYGPVDLVALARAEIESQQSGSGRHQIHLEAETAEMVVEADPARIGRVLANLLNNAVKYSPEGGPISVRVAPQGEDRAAITVRDAGIGIPAGDLPHVLDHYRRGANVAGRIPGTGLGLAGARQIVEQHGGEISVASEEGKGTSVTVILPRR